MAAAGLVEWMTLRRELVVMAMGKCSWSGFSEGVSGDMARSFIRRDGRTAVHLEA
jgi:hypothetical protein